MSDVKIKYDSEQLWLVERIVVCMVYVPRDAPFINSFAFLQNTFDESVLQAKA